MMGTNDDGHKPSMTRKFSTVDSIDRIIDCSASPSIKKSYYIIPYSWTAIDVLLLRSSFLRKELPTGKILLPVVQKYKKGKPYVFRKIPIIFM